MGRDAPARRRDWRETTFVEIGPITAFDRDRRGRAAAVPGEPEDGLGPRRALGGGRRERGWRIGVVDATPIGHTIRPAADGYPREVAAAEARRFLDGRPYVARDEVRTLAAHRIGETHA